MTAKEWLAFAEEIKTEVLRLHGQGMEALAQRIAELEKWRAAREKSEHRRTAPDLPP
jgi:hypothetical protein